VRGRIGERPDRPDEIEHRSGPAVRHDQRQRVRVLGLDVNEVNVEAVDPGHELRMWV
jgi:hypothetical protein